MSPIPTTDFTIEQHAAVEALAGLLRSAGLRAELGPLDYGMETIEVYRPRDPDLALWLLSASESGRIVVTELPSGQEWELPTVEASVEWIVTVEQGEASIAA